MIKISINDNLYPDKLRTIDNPPQNLYLEGNINLLNSNSIAIVGARNCSDNGKKIAAKFATELSSSGITIVSGLALGIDAIAHSYSYDKKGRTIAVLGSGFNKIFPKENFNLYESILENDGLIVTEYPPNEEAQSSYFLQRNRIVSGLSIAVMIVEAFSRSGTSNTAKYARIQEKNVFTVPHEIWDSRGVGTNRLLKQGAKLVTDTSEILDILKLTKIKNYYLKLKSDGVFNEFSRKSNYYIPEKEKNFKDSIIQNNTLDNQSKTNFESKEIQVAPIISDPKQAEIYNSIMNSSRPLLPNDLAHKTGYSINEILSILFMLEINENIKKVQGGYICS